MNIMSSLEMQIILIVVLSQIQVGLTLIMLRRVSKKEADMEEKLDWFIQDNKKTRGVSGRDNSPYPQKKKKTDINWEY